MAGRRELGCGLSRLQLARRFEGGGLLEGRPSLVAGERRSWSRLPRLERRGPLDPERLLCVVHGPQGLRGPIRALVLSSRGRSSLVPFRSTRRMGDPNRFLPQGHPGRAGAEKLGGGVSGPAHTHFQERTSTRAWAYNVTRAGKHAPVLDSEFTWARGRVSYSLMGEHVPRSGDPRSRQLDLQREGSHPQKYSTCMSHSEVPEPAAFSRGGHSRRGRHLSRPR